MARVKIAYVGGGSTRGAGTMASFIEQGENFSGSEIVLIDLDADRLELIRGLAQRMATRQGRGHHRVGDDRPARRPRRLRRGADQLSPRRLRGARARRAHPALARRHRAGDPGAGRLLHGAALDPRDAGDPRRHGGRVPRRADLQLHEPGQHRRAGRLRPPRHPVRVALRGADRLPGGDRRGGGAGPRAARRRERRAQPRLVERAPRPTTARTSCRCSRRRTRAARAIPSSGRRRAGCSGSRR